MTDHTFVSYFFGGFFIIILARFATFCNHWHLPTMLIIVLSFWLVDFRWWWWWWYLLPSFTATLFSNCAGHFVHFVRSMCRVMHFASVAVGRGWLECLDILATFSFTFCVSYRPSFIATLNYYCSGSITFVLLSYWICCKWEPPICCSNARFSFISCSRSLPHNRHIIGHHNLLVSGARQLASVGDFFFYFSYRLGFL